MLRRINKTFTLVAAVLIALSVVFLSAAVPAAPQASNVVVIKMGGDHRFAPGKVTVKVGQTVEWDNDEPNGLHQVTTDENAAIDPTDVSLPDGAQPFDSKVIKSGQSFKHQFTVPGVYKYCCPPHENMGMIGEVTVTK